jgi:ABC-type dipeptide/oligopeptide/nickel transport system permease component
MGSFLLRRLLSNLVVFVVVSAGVFMLIRASPGDPVSMMVDPSDALDGGADFMERKRHELGLDRPLAVQYLIWLRNALRGNLGYSYVSHRPVLDVLMERLWPTLQLMGAALVLGVLLALVLGVLAGARRNTMVDYLISTLSLGAISVPGFFLGIVGIYLFALTLGLFPSAGMTTPGGGGGADVLRHMVLPTAILSLAVAGPFVRYVRSGIIGELNADYVRTALAKGAPTRRVVLRHALPNALAPLITVLFLSVPHLLAGAVVTEQVFAWPGLGQLAVSSIARLDYPVIVGFVLYVAVLVTLCNLIADLLYSLVDPRMRQR